MRTRVIVTKPGFDLPEGAVFEGYQDHGHWVTHWGTRFGGTWVIQIPFHACAEYNEPSVSASPPRKPTPDELEAEYQSELAQLKRKYGIK